MLFVDRPENAQLLQRSGTTFLGRETIDDEAFGDDQFDVYRVSDAERGTAVRRWIDDDGELRRIDDAGVGGFAITVLDTDPQPEPAGARRLEHA